MLPGESIAVQSEHMPLSLILGTQNLFFKYRDKVLRYVTKEST